MKKLYFLFAAFLSNGMAYSQNVGIGTPTPNISAQLDVSSTTKGFLPPRMTGAQRDAISTPTAGLVVWCTDCGSGALQVFSGSAWTSMTGGAATTNNLTVGQFYQGGIIVYILQPGDPGYDASVPHGLIMAMGGDLNLANYSWSNGSNIVTGASGTAIGTGNANTNTIVTNQGAGTYAAKACSDLNFNGYSDWYLPSKDELNKMIINQAFIGGLTTTFYWSSSEFNNSQAWNQQVITTNQIADTKALSIRVRAFRSF